MPRPPRELIAAVPDRLRATINLGNPVLAQKDPDTGALGGVSVALARELGRRLGLPVELVEFDAAGKAFGALTGGRCDVGFLAVDPARAAELAFTPPYVEIEGTYIVPEGSPFRAVGDVDREGVRIAAGRNSAYDLFLSRALTRARLVHADTSEGALDLFLAEGLEAAGGVRQPLDGFARLHPGLRVLPDRFLVIRQAMAMPSGRGPDAENFLTGFVEEMKATGFVREALDRSGQFDAGVAPAAPGRTGA